MHEVKVLLMDFVEEYGNVTLKEDGLRMLEEQKDIEAAKRLKLMER